MNKNLHFPLTAAFLLLSLHFNTAGQDQWISLFDGETLEGWTIHSGHALYSVEEGTIVGQSVPNSPNSFLCTNREFGDFILEFEVLLEDNELNSGVQFRSRIAPQELVFWFRNEEGEYQPVTIPPDRVYGYQVEIASNGASGGVYDEARRAMLPWWPLEGSAESRAFTNNQWNAYRIECRGDAIKTIVNGVVVTDFRDALTDRGIIGLQVHDVGDDTTPYRVRWRNIRLLPLD
jgi:3-keto-disaccharide hydrolase